MIGFGELRRLSAQWQVDLADVERAYMLDWLLKGIFDHALLSRALVLRGSGALRYAHVADYPLADDPEFFLTQPTDAINWRDAWANALHLAAGASGLHFALADFEHGAAKVEYTGPLGRRSAAQPRMTLSIVPGQTRRAPASVSLIHRFSDTCAATVSAIALEEFTAERIATLAQQPRARDVFDLWFALTHARERINPAQVHSLVQEILLAKNIAPPRSATLFDPAHRAILERAWDGALKNVRHRPAFTQVEKDLNAARRELI